MSAQAAIDHQRAQKRIALGAAEGLGDLWSQVDADNIGRSWAEIVPSAVTLLSAAQLAAALGAVEYLDELLGAIAPAVSALAPEQLAGTASDGRDLGTLLSRPAITSLSAIKRGVSPRRALAAGRAQLDEMARTQTLDIGRSVEQVGMATRPRVVAYTRVVPRPACGRCIVLAGREYAWSEGFARHPRCDCTMRPMSPDERVEGDDPRRVFESMSRAQQDRSFGAHAAAAIREGADIGQVVNARRGMQSATNRTRGRYTTEGTTSRGYAGRRLGDLRPDASGRYTRSARPRLMPEAIMRDASDRQHALELLYEHGYLTSPPPPATGGG
ncbi:VG15 protein [Nocardiopsis lucentensis]|uniref:VG15 protein n=1 Tax=Nocardiopsis lucentensis TaxID=53441 RepID=UPI0003484337|nr:hypothetical protein [Nocardiopsis lucentensis]